MADRNREKVIKAYEDFVNGYECFCTSDDYEYEMHKAVLAMLKEQQQYIWELQDQVEYLTDKLKEQERIIKQYQKADGFLFAHGWKWGGR